MINPFGSRKADTNLAPWAADKAELTKRLAALEISNAMSKQNSEDLLREAISQLRNINLNTDVLAKDGVQQLHKSNELAKQILDSQQQLLRKVDELMATLAELQASVDATTAAVTAETTQVTAAVADIQTLIADIATLKAAGGATPAQLDAIKTSLDTAVANLTTSTTNLTTAVATPVP